MSKIIVTGQLTLTGGQLTAKATAVGGGGGNELWAWGYNAVGGLGDGTIIDKSSPVQIGALTDWASIGGGVSFSNAIKTDGTLWAWGEAANGRLGDGTAVDKSSPIQVGSDTDWAKISDVYLHAVALRNV